MSSALVILALLILLCLSFWRDMLWWSEVQRGRRAEQEQRSAVALYQVSAEIASPDRKPFSFIYLARYFFSQKQYPKAESYYLQAIEALKSLPGDNLGLLVTAEQELARTLVREGKLDQAQTVLRQTVKRFGDPRVPLPAVRMRMLGQIFIPDPNPGPTLIGTYTLLESAYVKQGKFEQAQKTFSENLGTFKNLEKPNIKAIAGITDLYCSILKDGLKEPNAYIDEAYAQAKKLVLEKFGDQVEALGRIEAAYGDRLGALGRADQSIKEYLSALNNLKSSQKHSDPIELRTMNRLASLYVKQNRFEDAETLYKEELDLASKWGAPMSPDVEIQFDACRSDYANLLRKLHRDDQAQKIFPSKPTK